MKIGLLGSGNVGSALAKGFLEEGHEVYLATRDPEGPKSSELKASLPGVQVCDFATAAKEGELIVLCTNWDAAEEALKLAGADNLKGKIVIDTNNPIGPGANGVARALPADESAGETVQTWLPDSHVVKAFNTTGAANFYKPVFELSPTMFIAGNDADAKKQVADIITSFGLQSFDAGDITAARELEAMAVVWINHSIRTKDSHHAFRML